LNSEHFSESENAGLYGKCNNLYGHGHNYILEVGVCGPIGDSGRAADIAALDNLVNHQVLASFSDRNFNHDVPEFTMLVPTSENIALVIRERLDREWRKVFPGEWPRLDRIRLQETKRNFFELRVS
jgi:6-pyruvoyltetrahydropterin/6-carboxytetrahydropterin synthase